MPKQDVRSKHLAKSIGSSNQKEKNLNSTVFDNIVLRAIQKNRANRKSRRVLGSLESFSGLASGRNEPLCEKDGRNIRCGQSAALVVRARERSHSYWFWMRLQLPMDWGSLEQAWFSFDRTYLQKQQEACWWYAWRLACSPSRSDLMLKGLPNLQSEARRGLVQGRRTTILEQSIKSYNSNSIKPWEELKILTNGRSCLLRLLKGGRG